MRLSIQRRTCRARNAQGSQRWTEDKEREGERANSKEPLPSRLPLLLLLLPAVLSISLLLLLLVSLLDLGQSIVPDDERSKEGEDANGSEAGKDAVEGDAVAQHGLVSYVPW